MCVFWLYKKISMFHYHWIVYPSSPPNYGVKLSLPCAPQFIFLGESLIRCFCLPSGKWQALLSSFSDNHYIYLGTFAFHFSYLCIWEPQMYFFSYLPGVDRNSRSCVASELWLMEAAGLETPAYNRPKWNCSTCNSTHSGNSHPERKSFLFSHFIDELLWCCSCGFFPLMLFPIVDSKEALFIPLLKIAVKRVSDIQRVIAISFA